MSASGDFVIAWNSGQDGGTLGDPYGVYARATTRQGRHKVKVRVNTLTINVQINPVVGMDPAGDFVIAWSSSTQDRVYGAYARRYNTAGAVQGGEFRVNTVTTNSQKPVGVAMDAVGNLVISFSDDTQDGNGYGAYAPIQLRWRPTGQRLFESTRSPLGISTLAAWGWTRTAISSSRGRVRTKTGATLASMDSTTTPRARKWESEFRVNTFTPGKQEFPSVAMNGAGDFVLAWSGDGPVARASRRSGMGLTTCQAWQLDRYP